MCYPCVTGGIYSGILQEGMAGSDIFIKLHILKSVLSAWKRKRNSQYSLVTSVYKNRTLNSQCVFDLWLPENSWQLCTTKGLFTLDVRGILRFSDTEKYQELLRRWFRLNKRMKCQNRLQCLCKICNTLLQSQVATSASSWQNLWVLFADSYIYLHIFL